MTAETYVLRLVWETISKRPTRPLPDVDQFSAGFGPLPAERPAPRKRGAE
jgi:hypothetical protein